MRTIATTKQKSTNIMWKLKYGYRFYNILLPIQHARKTFVYWWWASFKYILRYVKSCDNYPFKYMINNLFSSLYRKWKKWFHEWSCFCKTLEIKKKYKTVNVVSMHNMFWIHFLIFENHVMDICWIKTSYKLWFSK